MKEIILLYYYVNFDCGSSEFDQILIFKFNINKYLNYNRQLIYDTYSKLFKIYNPLIDSNEIVEELALSGDLDNILIAIEIIKSCKKQ